MNKFYNLQLFYWHFLEILWLFIFLVFNSHSQSNSRGSFIDSGLAHESVSSWNLEPLIILLLQHNNDLGAVPEMKGMNDEGIPVTILSGI